VSRYRLDDYLQLFDFPSPNLSAEKRFTTTVPLQRLFFMNSDFVQQQAEYLAQRVAGEPDNTARIQKAYRLVYGRAATPDEVSIGLAYLRAEPMKGYEEQKAAKEKTEKDKKVEPESPAVSEAGEELRSDGMMSGVTGPSHGKPGEEKKPPLPVTTWGRYAKVLLSSSEFLFVN